MLMATAPQSIADYPINYALLVCAFLMVRLFDSPIQAAHVASVELRPLSKKNDWNKAREKKEKKRKKRKTQTKTITCSRLVMLPYRPCRTQMLNTEISQNMLCTSLRQYYLV